MAKVKKNMASQERGLTCLASSTWGATLQKARTIYQAVVKPAMTYAAAIWHTPQGIPGAKKGLTSQLQLSQNRCLRTVIGTYKATPAIVLESEAYMPPIDLALDQIVLQSRLVRGTHPATKVGNARIRQNLKRTCRATRAVLTPPPSETKSEWARTSIGRALDDLPVDEEGARLERRTRTKDIHQRTLKEWTKRWQRYRATIPERRRHPALRENAISDTHLRRHGRMRKGDSALAIQLRTGNNGLAHFLHTVHAGNLTDASCSCGWRKQDATHILIACPLYADLRMDLFKRAGTGDSREILSSSKGIRAAARFMMATGLLPQFSLAREMEEVEEEVEVKRGRKGLKKPAAVWVAGLYQHLLIPGTEQRTSTVGLWGQRCFR